MNAAFTITIYVDEQDRVKVDFPRDVDKSRLRAVLASVSQRFLTNWYAMEVTYVPTGGE